MLVLRFTVAPHVQGAESNYPGGDRGDYLREPTSGRSTFLELESVVQCEEVVAIQMDSIAKSFRFKVKLITDTSCIGLASELPKAVIISGIYPYSVICSA